MGGVAAKGTDEILSKDKSQPTFATKLSWPRSGADLKLTLGLEVRQVGGADPAMQLRSFPAYLVILDVEPREIRQHLGDLDKARLLAVTPHRGVIHVHEFARDLHVRAFEPCDGRRAADSISDGRGGSEPQEARMWKPQLPRGYPRR